MQIRLASLALCLAAGGFLAAGEASPYEKALDRVIESFEKIGTTLKNITDEEGANSAKPELRKAADDYVMVRAAATKLQPPEKEEKVRLEKRYKPKIEEAMKKMFIEVQRVQVIPGGKDALKEIAGVLTKEAKK